MIYRQSVDVWVRNSVLYIIYYIQDTKFTGGYVYSTSLCRQTVRERVRVRYDSDDIVLRARVCDLD